MAKGKRGWKMGRPRTTGKYVNGGKGMVSSANKNKKASNHNKSVSGSSKLWAGGRSAQRVAYIFSR